MTPMPRDGKYTLTAWAAPAGSMALCSVNSSWLSVASPAGFQNAASLRPSAAIAACPIPTACAPTGNTRNSAPELLTTCALTRTGDAAASSTPASTGPPARQPQPSERLRLIDQHDRNVVFHGIAQAAGVAHQFLGRAGAVLQRAFALGTHEQLQQVGRETHDGIYPRRLREGS